MRGSNNPTGMTNGTMDQGRMARGPITGKVNNRIGTTQGMRVPDRMVPDRIVPATRTVPVFLARDRVAIGHPIVTGTVRRTTGANSLRVL